MPDNRKVTSAGLGQTLDRFLQSLEDVLIDITALEVNTMVVEQISASKFIAWEAYREIYPISPDYLEQRGIHESLRDRYLDLRRLLEMEYRALLSEPNSELYQPTDLNTVAGDDFTLTTRLPNPLQLNSPEEILNVQRLLRNCRFLRGLRKTWELKSALDNRNKTVNRSNPLQKAVITDTICAQTVIQLDGEILNRYNREIFDHSQRDVILQIHRESVTASQKQWRGLLELIISLVQAARRRDSN
ncbi:hypothetical protein IQ257_11625 [Coleofasciculus sp. LEGE 07092]|nr:hypothetical protein [Coleofasciculus sp. LEGE 07081]MBE9149127.1 hypothetical protein [Coleofasciculus sp. LEGE 07092]